MNRDELRRLPWRVRYEYADQVASATRRLALLATHRHADLRIDMPVRLGRGFSLSIPQPATLTIHAGCDFRRDFRCEIAENGVVEIGAGSVFTDTALIQVSTSLVIGQRCVFGQSVMIADGNHRFRDHTRHLLDQGYDFHPIVIEDQAVVLSKCTVLASLGRGAVIGAGSVVTRPVPAYCLAVGAPARVVEYFGPPGEGPDGLS